MTDKDASFCICGGVIKPIDDDWAACQKCGDDSFPISAEAAGIYDLSEACSTLFDPRPPKDASTEMVETREGSD